MIPGPRNFAVSLQADINKRTGACPFYGHAEEENLFDEEETLTRSNFVLSFF
jgi:hypothetical protein